MYENDAIPSMPGSADTVSAGGGQKVSLRLLPPGAKQGDTVELKIQRIDADGGMAYLTSVDSKTDTPEGSDQDQNGTGQQAQAPKGNVDTNTLLGPMDKLKGYLARKSVEVQSQI